MALRQLQIQPVILKKGKSENFIILYDSCFIYFSSTNIKSLTDTGEGSKLVYRRKRPKVDTLFSTLFFGRVRAASMTQRGVEHTRVHFWTFSPVSVEFILKYYFDDIMYHTIYGKSISNHVFCLKCFENRL